MTTKISEANIQSTTIVSLAGAGGPKISSIVVTNSSYTNLDDTAVALGGGYVKLIGSGFAAGCQVLVGLTPATSVTYISGTEVRAQLPATAAGTYVVYLINSDGGTAIRVNAVTFSGTPTWVSASELSGASDTAISIQLSATDVTTFALAAGSTLPAGVSLSSSGLLSGTVTGITEDTVYNFTINAVDDELQDSPRSFAFTVTAGDQYFKSTTLLLTGSANTFVKDASTNNFALTVSGDTKPSNFNPYLTGWSNYFGSASSTLTVADNTAWDMDTDYSIEAFCYLTSYNTSDQYYIVSQIADTGQRAWGFGVANGKIQIYYSSNGTAQELFITSDSFTVTANQWYHFAVTRTSSGVYTFYVNGIATGTTTNTASIFKSNQPLTIGQFGNFGISSLRWDGYISNLRILRGAIAYASNFTPSTTPLTAITGTVLLTCADNQYKDDSTNNFAITRNGDVAVRSFSPFVESASSRGSTYYDGNGDYFTAAADTAFDFGTGDFTIEAWVYPISNGLNFPTFLGSVTGWSTGASGHRFNNVGYANKFWFGLNGSSGIASGDPFMASTNTFSFNTWHHYALTRSGNTFKMFVNGVLENTQTFAGSYNAGLGGLRSGWSTWDAGQGYFTGYVNNLRLVKGTALYTSAFTPPTSPLTATTGTSLLTLQSNTPIANNTFLDSSSNNLLVTRAGNATQGSFSPYSPSSWSNYFDGTGDALSSPTTGDLFNFGTGDFCVEAFVNLNSTAEQYVVGTYDGGNGGWAMYLSPTGSTINFRNGDASQISRTFSFAIGTWYHIAVTRSSSTLRFFVNGTQVGTDQASYTQNISRNNTNGCAIGRYMLSDNQNGWYVTGYISNLRVIKGAAVYTANFTALTQPLTAITGTSLLTCADNRFIDESANNFTITRAGDVRVTNWSPFKAVVQTPQTYSAYFDGTGDYLSLANNVALQFTADFTIEMWLYPTALSGVKGLFGQRATESNYSPIILEFNGAILNYQVSTSGSAWAVNLSGPSLTANIWTHIALVRNSTTVTLYVNGVSVGTGTASGALMTPVAPTYLGANSGSPAGAGYFPGYISNFRIVKGTAVYTSAFTPSTTPLAATTGTSLLTCQSSTFIDNSTNRFAITAVGNSQPTTVNPFGSTFAISTGYTAVEYSGSAYFDGTGDYLITPAGANAALGTGDFTIECWIYVTAAFGTSTPGRAALISNRTVISSNTSFTLQHYNGKIYFGTPSTDVIVGGTTMTINTWWHVVVTRSSGTVRLFLNGVSDATAVSGNTTNFSDTSAVYIGCDGSYLLPLFPYTGYISNLRIVKGQALYTSNFAAPITPVQSVQNTVLLLNGTSAGIVDATTKNLLETAGDVKVSSAVSKFGGSSMYFDGTGDYLNILSSSLMAFGNANFTLECWIYIASPNDSPIYEGRSAGSSTAGFTLTAFSSTVIRIFCGSALISATVANYTNTWTHVAVVRNSGTTTLYVNGNSGGTTTSLGTMTDTQPLVGGGRYSSNSSVTAFFNGYLQDFRITQGIARYTTNFTPTGTAFQTR